ncbi:MAG: hypothetical protein ACYDC6_03205 [Acidobacteriaceae bacterium]
MRTTVDIPDALYRELKSKAAHEGCSVKDIVLSSILVRLTGHTIQKQNRRRPPVVASREPGTLKIDNERIFDIIGFP